MAKKIVIVEDSVDTAKAVEIKEFKPLMKKIENFNNTICEHTFDCGDFSVKVEFIIQSYWNVEDDFYIYYEEIEFKFKSKKAISKLFESGINNLIYDIGPCDFAQDIDLDELIKKTPIYKETIKKYNDIYKEIKKISSKYEIDMNDILDQL